MIVLFFSCVHFHYYSILMFFPHYSFQRVIKTHTRTYNLDVSIFLLSPTQGYSSLCDSHETQLTETTILTRFGEYRRICTRKTTNLSIKERKRRKFMWNPAFPRLSIIINIYKCDWSLGTTTRRMYWMLFW